MPESVHPVKRSIRPRHRRRVGALYRGGTDRFEDLLRQLAEFPRHASADTEIQGDIAVRQIAWTLDQDPERADHLLGSDLAAPGCGQNASTPVHPKPPPVSVRPAGRG